MKLFYSFSHLRNIEEKGRFGLSYVLEYFVIVFLTELKLCSFASRAVRTLAYYFTYTCANLFGIVKKSGIDVVCDG